MCKKNLEEVENFFGKSFDELFLANEKYIYITIDRFYRKYKKTMWIEDIQQCGKIGLANAIETLDINRADSFKNHIITCIRREVLYFENSMFGVKGYSKRNENDKGIESLNKINGKDEGKSWELIDTVAATLDEESYVAKKIDLYRAIDNLEENEKLIIKLLLESKTQKTIAKELGLAEATITQRLKKIYKKLKVLLE